MTPRHFTPEPPRVIERPIMRQQWRDLTYLHWRFPPEVVQDRLPSGLKVDTFDGSAWVGLVPFRMVDIAAAAGPPVPYLGTFPETNIRTYVTGSRGPGVWFDSLDISRVIPVLVARLTYRLPYMWAQMSIERSGPRITYRARRRWPGPRRTSSHVSVDIGDRIRQPDDLAHFLSARWGLYTMLSRKLGFAAVSHEPWPLHDAAAVIVDDSLLEAAGYPAPDTPPHTMYSPGVSVRIERPRLA